jgi:sec-independent protein translocase protein TatA
VSTAQNLGNGQNKLNWYLCRSPVALLYRILASTFFSCFSTRYGYLASLLMLVLTLLFISNPKTIIFIIFVLVLFFGAKRIPELFRGIGQGVREFKDASTDQQHPNYKAPTPPQPPYGQPNHYAGQPQPPYAQPHQPYTQPAPGQAPQAPPVAPYNPNGPVA